MHPNQEVVVQYIPTVKDEAKNVKTPFETWSLLFSNKMLEIIVSHTNEEIDRKYCVEPRASYQTHVNLDELKAFIGLLYFSGI